MKAGKIVTLCSDCAALLRSAYEVKEISDIRTEKKKQCEQCRKKRYVLNRYLIAKKEGGKT